jgi:hypothetical protein
MGRERERAGSVTDVLTAVVLVLRFYVYIFDKVYVGCRGFHLQCQMEQGGVTVKVGV